MHIEILTEDNSGQRLLEHLVPKLIGPLGEPHTWRFHPYRGIGRIPANLSRVRDPSRRILLEQLPRVLRGYVRTPGIDAVVVVLDADDRDCVSFLCELQTVAATCGASQLTLFRLAIEEVEAWYLGDRSAVRLAYPNARMQTLDSYVQDAVCGTWELLAEAIHPGGMRAIRQAGWPLPGQLKHDWATRIGPHLDPASNRSPSFVKLRDGMRRLANIPRPDQRPSPSQPGSEDG
jgi:hypothetical protein